VAREQYRRRGGVGREVAPGVETVHGDEVGLGVACDRRSPRLAAFVGAVVATRQQGKCARCTIRLQGFRSRSTRADRQVVQLVDFPFSSSRSRVQSVSHHAKECDLNHRLAR
jgi:hypothetical protein